MRESSAVFFALALVSSISWAEDFDYSVMSRAETQRIDNMVARNMSSLDDPCLYIEILDPENNWSPIRKKSICALDGRSLISDFTYASFSNVKFSLGGLQAYLTLIPLQAVIEDVLHCSIKLMDDEIGSLECSQGREGYY